MYFNFVMYRAVGIDGKVGIYSFGKVYYFNLGFCGNVCYKYKFLVLVIGLVLIVIC